jgi:hypothetical protein
MSDEIIGRATRMGWKRRKSGDKFEVVIELDKAPGWPISVVWDAMPITLLLKTAQGKSDG